MVTTVRQMLAGKSNVYSVKPEATVFEALEVMASRNIGAVLVQTDTRLVGILSERDYARKVMLLGKSSKEIHVRDIMTKEVVCVEPGWTTEHCLALMDQRQIRHLPVMEHGVVVGVISMGDVVHAKLTDQQFTITQLSNYITSGA
jgi:CBS domain-containing protein